MKSITPDKKIYFLSDFISAHLITKAVWFVKKK
jgi:hypothetical protein